MQRYANIFDSPNFKDKKKTPQGEYLGRLYLFADKTTYQLCFRI